MTISRPGPYAGDKIVEIGGVLSALYDDLPVDPSALREVVSQLITRGLGSAIRYSAKHCDAPRYPAGRGSVKLIQSIRAGSLAAQRPDKRTFGVPGLFVDYCALRHRSIPARVAADYVYFPWRPYEDRWICEYWSRANTMDSR